MLRLSRLFLIVIVTFLWSGIALNAQCDGCVPDSGCFVDPPFPTMCPLSPVDAIAGEYYSSDITFWLPETFTDPGSGFAVSFEQMTITSVSGLPFGLNMTPSEPGGVYYPQLAQYGCARICGTPLGPGTFAITITILASVVFNGISLDVPQQFVVTLVVLPGAGSNSSFAFTPQSGCAGVSVSFQSLIDGSPLPTSWNWDLGNGNTSADQHPTEQTYSDPGSYVITLETTIGGFVLNSVSLTGTNSNWCGDIEEPNIPLVGCTGSPDPYFVLTDANGGTFTSSTVNNTFTPSWTNLGLVLDNAPYSISFYDEDAISQNDLLGTYNIPANGSGTYFINIAGGTTGSLTVASVTLQTFVGTDTLLIFPLPEFVLIQNMVSGELCASVDSLVGYVWLVDGDTLSAAFTACINPDIPGIWQVVGTNGFGCTTTSNAIVVCPQVSMALENNVLWVPSGFLSYSWSYNDTPVGSNQPFLLTLGDGVYSVTISAENDCVLTVEYTLNTVGISDLIVPTVELLVYPNPSNGAFLVEASGVKGNMVRLSLFDAAGNLLQVQQGLVTQGQYMGRIDRDLAPGAYLIVLSDGHRSSSVRALVE